MRKACTACAVESGEVSRAAANPALAALAARTKQLPKSGILSINKPAGLTSHDVVAAIRRASGEQRVGHAGTLDPMATGVLLVCLGSATRVIEHLQNHPKKYRADIHLGIATDTYDAEGRVTYQAPNLDVDRAQVEAALADFRGTIQQVPPMYSALKHEGRPLYALARAGVELEREPRTVEIYRLDITDWAFPVVQVEIECSKGTYIRALAHDLGQKLGVGAHLTRLVRLASGRFTLSQAESLETVEDSFKHDYWMYLLHPLDEALLEYDAMIVDQDTETRIRQGQPVEAPGPIQTRYARAYSLQGDFIGLLKYDRWTGLWQPDKVFPKK